MNIISFSIFGSRQTTKENFWLFATYLRTFYWNVRMARLLYPSFQIHVEVDSGTFSDFDNIFYGLKEHYGISFSINEDIPLCMKMLWRLKPIFWDNADTVVSRDADAILTMRERKCVQEFINSGMTVHAITDDPMHGTGLMGGMIAVKAKPIREKYGTWENMLSKSPIQIAGHGTDQQFMNAVLYPEYKSQMFCHYLNGEKGNGEAIVKNEIANVVLDGVNPTLWESNLCARHIGSAGVVELETRRFFLRHDKETGFEEIAKRYPAIFPWYINQ